MAYPGGATLMSGSTGVNLDVVFPVLHGPYGEDGTVQGLLELANVPYVGAGVLASAVGMDKAAMKLVFAAKRLPICDYEVVLKRDWQRDERPILTSVVNRLGFPMFVKPANLGSSVGISKAKHASELRTAINLAAEFDRKIVIEAAAKRLGVETAPSGFGDEDVLRAAADEAGAAERALLFGAQQLALQHHALWDLLEARAQARAGA